MPSNNPTPFLPFCARDQYPYWCREGESCSLRGLHNRENESAALIVGLVTFAIDVTVITFLILTIRSLSHDQEQGRTALSICESVEKDMSDDDGSKNNHSDLEGQSTSKPTNRRVSKFFIFQAAGYIAALLVTQSFIPIRLTRTQSIPWQTFVVVMRPLQGFWNFLIFTSDKVYNYRLTNPEISKRRSWYIVLTRPLERVIVFSEMSMLQLQNEKKEVKGNSFRAFPLSLPAPLGREPDFIRTSRLDVKSHSHSDSSSYHSEKSTEQCTDEGRSYGLRNSRIEKRTDIPTDEHFECQQEQDQQQQEQQDEQQQDEQQQDEQQENLLPNILELGSSSPSSSSTETREFLPPSTFAPECFQVPENGECRPLSFYQQMNINALRMYTMGGMEMDTDDEDSDDGLLHEYDPDEVGNLSTIQEEDSGISLDDF